MDKIANYIDGELQEPLGGRYLDNVDPATGAVYSQIPDSDGADVNAAVDAAERAFPAWSETPAAERSRPWTGGRKRRHADSDLPEHRQPESRRRGLVAHISGQ